MRGDTRSDRQARGRVEVASIGTGQRLLCVRIVDGGCIQVVVAAERVIARLEQEGDEQL